MHVQSGYSLRLGCRQPTYWAGGCNGAHHVSDQGKMFCVNVGDIMLRACHVYISVAPERNYGKKLRNVVREIFYINMADTWCPVNAVRT